MKNLNIFIALFFLVFNMQAQAPDWLWAKNAGTVGEHAEGSIVYTDINGNVYVSGKFGDASISSITFDTVMLNSAIGGENIFVVKYNPDGNAIWAKNALAENSSVCTDIYGNVYVTGEFWSVGMTFGDTLLFNAYPVPWLSSDIFLAKFDSLGNEIWLRRDGSRGSEIANDITTDASGNVFVTGLFGRDSSSQFDSTILINNGGIDIFITKYDTSGNVIWARSFGGSSYERGEVISTDPDGNIYVAGTFEGDSLNLGNTVLINSSVDTADIFLVKLDSSGNFVWAKSAGNSSEDKVRDISNDQVGNVYLTGSFRKDTMFFDNIILVNSGGPGYHLFVCKYDSAGQIVWARTATCMNAFGTSVCTAADGNVYAAGYFGGLSINFGNSNLTNPHIGGNIFIVKFDSLGNDLWVTGADSTCEVYLSGIAIDPGNHLYVTGHFNSIPLQLGNTTLTNAGYDDMYIAKLVITPVGISAPDKQQNSLLIFPNPATNYFTVSSPVEIEELRITNFLGQLIYQSKPMSTDFSITLNQPGIYFVKTTVGKNTVIKKLVVY